MQRIGIVFFVMAAVAWVPGLAAEDEAASSRGDCFDIRQVRNWDAIDNRHIYLEASRKNRFLLTMFARCTGIRFAEDIVLSNQTGRVCSNDFGKVTYRDGQRLATCSISDIQRVADKAEAVAIVQEQSTQKTDDEEDGSGT